ncbi:metal-dependent hydrolase [Thalassobacillus sp. CUG 92003]|uniref:metal-dependent hydrolase n=1 Tax=Thalassobacillus sp. CUG 92003 TaxID=2736641 RepID=UPI0015E7A5E3|nr:metal-dependent hydrolase [Thalassobacillus sp. CUG 92003]
MMATGHQVVGFTFGLMAITVLQGFGMVPTMPLHTVLYFVFVLFGSLLPDIDSPRSRLGNKFWRLLMLLFFTALAAYLFFPEWLNRYRDELKVFVMFMLPVLVMIKSHRKATHSLFFIGCLWVYSYVIVQWLDLPWFYLHGLLAGAFSHLVGDFVTKKGIPVFYPFSSKYVRFFFTFKTGSLIEKGIVTGLVVLNSWYLIMKIF